MCIVFKKPSEYTYVYVSKKYYFINFCCLFIKSLKAFSVSLIVLKNWQKKIGWPGTLLKQIYINRDVVIISGVFYVNECSCERNFCFV